ncbi:helix-turn-helix domain-containing protein [Streptomyces yaizuensis]|uniref:Scr1 family TA system antitoxin-like transcriptional regulator n=1 Tax=Streptomyces yaizuensis TaxID=2989713 RepID=A0ABQ5P9T7_9ACTN|nr:helix-turn-helix transcriptional regulator [Streptomyces sp. YSPA8]GLF99355.1 Scr1 family TA system antitoxin-like transcriptional regulator [Streptomyces sp. YSPA8]
MDDDETQKVLTPVEIFGVDVREMRLARRMSVRGLGAAVGYSGAYVSKVERATIVPSAKFAEGCDRAFGTGAMMARQRQSAVEGDHPTWFVPYLQHERKASRIFTYSTLYVMGMLQTPEYARALYRRGPSRFSSSTIDAKVLERASRREVLDRTDPAPPVLWVVLHEASLRVVMGGPQIMERQLKRLLEDAERPNVTLQFMPFGCPPATDAPFTLLAFDDAPTVLHAEGPQGGRPQDTPKITSAAIDTYDRLRAEALGQSESLTRIRKILEEYAP